MKRPVWILHVFVVGLAAHNLVMAELYAAGLHGTALELVSSWKEALLALGLVLVFRARGLGPYRPTLVDALALAYGAIVVVYGLLPQHWLGGAASHRGVLLGVREDLLPVACYFFGRGLQLSHRELRLLGATILATAACAALGGLVDIYAVPLSWWRESGAPGWFSHQLGFAYKGLSNLPENFVYNTGHGHPYRRLVSSFLSPLASSYLFVTALLLAAVWRMRRRPPLALWLPTVALLSAGLLWTHARSSYLALALGLAVIALRRPDWRLPLALAACGAVGVGLLFVKLYPRLAPATSFTKVELATQVAEAHAPGASAAVNGLEDASISSHWRSLRAGVRQVLTHPQGFGPGNAGATAARTGVEVRAGESTYTQLGIDAGLGGGLVFIAWSLALLWRVLRANVWLGATLVAILALGLQTDIIGVPWIVYVLWTLAGAALSGVPKRGAEQCAAL